MANPPAPRRQSPRKAKTRRRPNATTSARSPNATKTSRVAQVYPEYSEGQPVGVFVPRSSIQFTIQILAQQDPQFPPYAGVPAGSDGHKCRQKLHSPADHSTTAASSFPQPEIQIP